MIAIQFKLKPTKKRRLQDKSAGKKKLKHFPSGVFLAGEYVQEEDSNVSLCRVEHRVRLLEDAQAKVKRLKDEGNTLAESGRYRAAMGRWQEALGVDPKNPALYDLLAQASMAVYEDFQAIQFARKTIELAPTWSEGYLTLARCQLNFGELALAAEALKRAVEHNGGIETEEMSNDRRDLEKLLRRQDQVLRKRDEEATHEVEKDKLQIISCFKHLSLRAKAINSEH